MNKGKNIADMVLNFLTNCTLSQAEQEGLTNPKLWIDHRYEYKRKRLEICAISFCDGSYEVNIVYDGRLVFDYDDPEGDFKDGKTIIYKPGEWEKIIYKLDVRGCNKQERL